MVYTIHREQIVPAPLQMIWDFFSNPRNLNELTPPDLSFRIIGEVAERMYAGQIIEYRVSFMPGFWSKWLTEITHVRDRAYFVDEQRLGPYKLWHHEHHFVPVDGGVRIIDKVTYIVGFGPIGAVVNMLFIRGKLRRIFDFRRERVSALFPGA